MWLLPTSANAATHLSAPNHLGSAPTHLSCSAPTHLSSALLPTSVQLCYPPQFSSYPPQFSSYPPQFSSVTHLSSAATHLSSALLPTSVQLLPTSVSSYPPQFSSATHLSPRAYGCSAVPAGQSRSVCWPVRAAGPSVSSRPVRPPSVDWPGPADATCRARGPPGRG